MTIHIHHDKETYSEIDLTKVGVYKYADHPSTDCLLTSGYVRGEKRTRRWRPGDPFPYRDFDPRELIIHAWNSQFERRIWWQIMVPRYGWPKLDLEQFVCTAAHARMMAASPGKLDSAGAFFGTATQKDRKGHLHMLKMCRPATEKEQLEFMRGLRDGESAAEWAEAAKRCHHTPANIDRLHDYCDDDVWTEADIGALLPPWPLQWRKAFWEAERINDHGIVVDVDFARAATAYAEDEKAYYAEEISRITDGVVTTPRQFQRIKEWALPRMIPEAVAITEHYDDGVKKNSFDADTRSNLLLEDDLEPGFLSEEVRRFIEILDAAGKSTISKYEAVTNIAAEGLTDENTRIHGQYMYAGAAQSGRFSSHGIQVHNLKRVVPKEAAKIITTFKREPGNVVRILTAAYKKPMEPIHALAELVRPTLIGSPADEFDLGWCDWSSIEARGLPWLANDPRCDDRLAMFRRGEDVYLKTAGDILGRKITKEDEFERQAYGKVPELSLGYLGGAGAFFAMAKNYGVRLDEPAVQRIVRTWREANPWAMDFGRAAEAAAIRAMTSSTGASFAAGRICYQYDPDALDGLGALFAMLPSGRELCYPGARLDVVTTKFGKEKLGITAMKGAWKPKKGDEDNWPRVSVWPGLLVENATQAVCADLLMIALVECRAAGLTVCAHTHDEIVIESPNIEADVKTLLRVMTTRPGWPGDDALPLKAEAGYGYRYKVPFEDAEKMEMAA